MAVEGDQDLAVGTFDELLAPDCAHGKGRTRKQVAVGKSTDGMDTVAEQIPID